MPLFGKSTPSPPPEKRGFFSRSSPSPPPEKRGFFRRSTPSPPPEKHGFFNRPSASSTDVANTSPTNGSFVGSGLFSRGEDSSIAQARQKLHDAEQAEKNADRALLQAKTAVKEVQDHLKRLERDLEEECVPRASDNALTNY